MPLTGAAAARLYDDHVDAVHALIARRVGPKHAPAVTGEAFESALQTWDQFDPNRGTERLFVFGAAVRTIRTHGDIERAYLDGVRIPRARPARAIDDPLVAGRDDETPIRTVRQHTADSDHNRPAAENESDAGTEDARSMRAIVELEPEDRDIVLLSVWESCSQSAIAEVLHVSVSSVRSSLGRIRRELKIAVAGDRR